MDLTHGTATYNFAVEVITLVCNGMSTIYMQPVMVSYCIF